MVTAIDYEHGKIVHVQSVMHEAKVTALVNKTGAGNTKDAIVVAVDKYLEE